MKTPKTKRMTPRARKEVDVSTYSGRFAMRLKALREKTGMSVDQLAEASGISRTTLYNWESGLRKIIVDDTVLTLAEHLNVEVRTLFPKK